MKPSAFKKSLRLLAQAKDSLPNLAKLQNELIPENYERAWYEFLCIINSIPETLKTGSREEPKSRQWYASKEQIILKDPMLKYLRHARAVGYHSDIQLLRIMTPFGPGKESVYDINGMASSGILNDITVPKHINQFRVWYEALPVTTLEKDVIKPPTTHLGFQLFDKSPLGLAQRSIAFYRTMVAEAEAYVA